MRRRLELVSLCPEFGGARLSGARPGYGDTKQSLELPCWVQEGLASKASAEVALSDVHMGQGRKGRGFGGEENVEFRSIWIGEGGWMRGGTLGYLGGGQDF